MTNTEHEKAYSTELVENDASARHGFEPLYQRAHAVHFGRLSWTHSSTTRSLRIPKIYAFLRIL